MPAHSVVAALSRADGSRMSVVVIGGGISGLACAWQLLQHGVPVILLERSARLGGVIDTVESAGFRFDIGPQSFLATPQLTTLIEQLGISDELVKADPRAPRYILFHERLVRAPLGPLQLLRTPLIGPRTKWRIATEVLRRTHPPAHDESIASFVRRKFGDDLLANLVAPFVSGVYAGDPEKLSLASAFPILHGLEERYGSLIRGAVQSRRASAKSWREDAKAPHEEATSEQRAEPQAKAGAPRAERPSLCNFKLGMNTLVAALADKLGDTVLRDVEITAIRRSNQPPSDGAMQRGAFPAGTLGNRNSPASSPHNEGRHGDARFEIEFQQAGTPQRLAASAVVIATPTDEAARLLAPVEAQFAAALAQIDYASVAQVSAGYRQRQISWHEPANSKRAAAAGGVSRTEHQLQNSRPWQGFGFLVPRAEHLRLLGTVWNSALFPNRAPEIVAAEPAGGSEAGVGFTSFVGGATDPEICRLANSDIARIAHTELASVLGITGSPVAQHVTTWPRAIPQYNVGHARIVDQLTDLCARTPGIFLAGNYLAGPSIGSCIDQAGTVASKVVRFARGHLEHPAAAG